MSSELYPNEHIKMLLALQAIDAKLDTIEDQKGGLPTLIQAAIGNKIML